MSLAVERIEASRQRLIDAMAPPPPSPPKRGSSTNGKAGGTRPSVAGRLRAFPTVTAIVESVRAWWSQHPLRPLGTVAGEASRAVAAPIAAQHPYGLVLGAAVVGAVLARARPWRWIFRSALFAGLLPQLASRVVATLPIESWFSMFGNSVSRSAASRHASADTAAAGAPARP